MQTKVKWVGGMSFLGTSDSGHNVVFDARPKGESNAPSPMEMVLMTVASCASVDVVDALSRDGKQISACDVDIQGERVNSVPRVFSGAQLHFKIQGENMSAEDVEKAVMDSANKYCSVAKMLEATVDINFTFEFNS